MSSNPRRTALITGASSGIGRACARNLAAEGADLVLLARREALLVSLAADLKAEFGTTGHVLSIDLTEPDAVDRVMFFLEDRRLEIDLLVNNAGFGLVGPFHESDRKDVLDMIQLNVTVLTDLTRRLLPDMVRRGSGQILNVASSAAFQPAPLMGLYHATKAFVLFLTEAIAEEVRGTGVHVTALCPGPVGQTEFGKRLGTEEKVPGLDLVRVPAAGVAAKGLEGVARGKTIVVPGLIMRLSSVISPRLPRWFVRKVTHRIQRSRV